MNKLQLIYCLTLSLNSFISYKGLRLCLYCQQGRLFRERWDNGLFSYRNCKSRQEPPIKRRRKDNSRLQISKSNQKQTNNNSKVPHRFHRIQQITPSAHIIAVNNHGNPQHQINQASPCKRSQKQGVALNPSN